MKSNLAFVLLSVWAFQSCIPLRIAPKIDDYRVVKGKKFKKSLPTRQMFVFEDPKDIDEFYRFVDAKFHLNNQNVYDDVPFILDGIQYFFSFYESHIPDKTINLGGMMVDAMLQSAELSPVFEDNYSHRRDNWYIAVEVYSDLEKDCLAPESLSREAVLKYLRNLKFEYLTTTNYNEAVFKN